MSERTLTLLRHAKSDWPAGVSDIDRPLADRGRRDAPVAGRVLAERVLAERVLADAATGFDAVLISPAQRTRQTWALVSEHVSADRVLVEPALYEASARTLLAAVRALPDSPSTVLLIGHNPGLGDLAVLLAGSGDADARERIDAKFPTCGIAVLEFSGPWSGLAPGGATLVGFHIPRADSVGSA